MVTDLYYFENGTWFAALDETPDSFSGQKPLMPWIFYSWTSADTAGITLPYFLYKDGSYNVDENNDGQGDGYMYFYGGNHGSHVAVYLGRVPYGQQDVIDRGAYEYWNGSEWKPLNYQDGSGEWLPSDMSDAQSVVVPHEDFSICNLSVSYNHYINKYIMLIAESPAYGAISWGGDINMYISDNVSGPFQYVNTVITDPWEVMNDGALVSHSPIETMSVLEWQEDGSAYLVLQIYNSDPCDNQPFIFEDCGYGMYLIKAEWISP